MAVAVERDEPGWAFDFGAAQGRGLEQAANLRPHERVELVGADRAAVADAPGDVAVVVRADAAVVVDATLGGARRAAPAGVAAVAVDQDAP